MFLGSWKGNIGLKLFEISHLRFIYRRNFFICWYGVNFWENQLRHDNLLDEWWVTKKLLFYSLFHVVKA